MVVCFHNEEIKKLADTAILSQYDEYIWFANLDVKSVRPKYQQITPFPKRLTLSTACPRQQLLGPTSSTYTVILLNMSSLSVIVKMLVTHFAKTAAHQILTFVTNIRSLDSSALRN